MSEKAVIGYVELSLFTFCKYIGGGLMPHIIEIWVIVRNMEGGGKRMPSGCVFPHRRG